MNVIEFTNMVGEVAVRLYPSTRILPSTVIAQACLETGYGQSVPDNNYFGIKGKGGTKLTREFVNGEWITIKAAFAGYENLEASVLAHNQLLNNLPRYDKIPNNLDYKAVCQELQGAGYATDPTYAKKLMAIIESLNLVKFDQDVLAMVEPLHDDEINFILDVLGYYWEDMAGNEAIQDYTHTIANRLREVYDIPKED